MVLFLATVGMVCVLYGVAVMAVGSGTWFFAFWFVVGVVLLAFAGALRVGWWDTLSLAGRRTVVVLACAALVVYAGTLGLQAKDFNDRGEPSLDFIIVPGAQIRGDQPSAVLKLRLDSAYDYLVANEGTTCIVSGGQGPNEEMPEADAMASYLAARGIDPARIVIENASANTMENIENSMAFFDPATARVGIVTNNFHVFRSVAHAHKAGVVNVCGIAAPSNPFYLPNNMTRESLSIIKNFALGKI